MRWINFRLLVTGFLLLGLSVTPLYADDTVLFSTSVAPDALIVLDLSGSMRDTPPGEDLYGSDAGTCMEDGPYYGTPQPGYSKLCVYISNSTTYSNTGCTGPFYKTSGWGHTTVCTKLAISKRALFDLLDADDDGTIRNTGSHSDEAVLGVRLGYMRWYNCGVGELSLDYNSGCNTVRDAIPQASSDHSYESIWSHVNLESAIGWTPLTDSLNEAKKYLEDHKAGDVAQACRKKFVVLVTDGWDSTYCGETSQAYQYKRSKAAVKAAKAFADAGYQIFIVGFGGNMPTWQKYPLNWMAYYGATNNPGDSDSPDPVTPLPLVADPCTAPDDPSTDPGVQPLTGYAFLADDTASLADALKKTMKYIREKAFTFTAPTVPSVRLTDTENIYISSFRPTTTPFWDGQLRAYQLNEDGTLPVDQTGYPSQDPVWQAMEQLATKSPDSRNIYTAKSASGSWSRVAFTTGELSPGDLGLFWETDKVNLIKHVRGYDPYDVDQDLNTTESRMLKLGDIFHSQAVIVGSPSKFFFDQGYSGTGGFYDAKKNRTKVILVGANDGMLHAFDAATGEEKWAFIPPGLLTSLKLMKSRWDTYKATGSAGEHLYYVDASPRVSDVWFPSDGADTNKSADEWRTVLISGLRKGGKTYFALDITDTTDPQFLWQFPRADDAATLAKMGQSWSDPAIGKVLIDVGGNLVERWVAFIGGGYRENEDDWEGRYVFVVDIATGNLIREISGFDAPIASPVLAVDTNNNGYVDRFYVGDLEGRMYKGIISDINPANWTQTTLALAPGSESGKHNIFYPPAVSFDSMGTPWVYYGTGPREDPLASTTERFYAIKDNGLGPYPRTVTDLVDATNNPSTFAPAPSNKYGWTIKLPNKEKVLAKPVVFHQLVYFTTYTPREVDSDPCTTGGTARLYVAEFQSGGGALLVDDLGDLSGSTTERSKVIGSGVPSTPIITMNSSGQISIVIGTTENQIYSQEGFSPSTMKRVLYWREAYY